MNLGADLSWGRGALAPFSVLPRTGGGAPPPQVFSDVGAQTCCALSEFSVPTEGAARLRPYTKLSPAP